MKRQDYFSIGALQPEVYHCNSRKEIQRNLSRILELLRSQVRYLGGLAGAPCRLIVLPEFGLHGMPQRTNGSWNGLAIDIPGEETESLSEVAKEFNIYLAAHAWTVYPDFPGRPFSVGFLIAPDGEIILKHHKIVTSRIIESGSTSPGDAYDWFIEKFGDGLDAFFPVADTELGKMGFVICGDGTYPEVSRGLMMNGAEILLRPNAWVESFMSEPQDLMAVCSRFNAFANMCYLVESNWSYYYAPGSSKAPGAGGSQVIDYAGRVLVRSSGPSETGVAAEINMHSLRRYREEISFGARTAYMPMYIFRKIYDTEMWPKNTLLKKEVSLTFREWDRMRQEVIERRRDIYSPSGQR